MPNWTTNELTITGDVKELAKLKKKVKGKESKFSFHRILPRPKSLDITAGSSTSSGLALLRYQKGNSTEIDEMLQYPWVKEEGINSREELVKHLIDTKRANLKEAKMYLSNEKKYGYGDWYGWSVAKWGTKWDASDVKMTEGPKALVYTFYTAWCSPLPVIVELSKQYPKLEFHIHSGYEGEDESDDITIKNGKEV